MLKLFETFGRMIGLAVRSLLNINIPFPQWFWDLLWYGFNSEYIYKQNNNNINNVNKQYILSIRKGLFFILPKQIQYLLTSKQFKLLVCGSDELNNEYSLSSFSIQQLLFINNNKKIFDSSPLKEKYIINKTSFENNIVLKLESTAIYCEPLNRNSSHINMFWNVLFSLNKIELLKFIQFISGHNIWPLYITSHSNPSQMIEPNIYANYISLPNNNKKLPITSINLSTDILYEIEYINYLVKSYHLYGSIMHNKINNPHIIDEMNNLWIIDECCITFCEQTSLMKQSPNKFLPEVHTCTVSIRLPHYSSEKELKLKLLKAIEFCNTFDSLNTQFPISKIIQKRNKTFKLGIAQKLQQFFT
eukprot:368721_1